ncbi:MAG: hypothetical protein ACE5EE_00525 [Fidelibacterota bacterium]
MCTSLTFSSGQYKSHLVNGSPIKPLPSETEESTLSFLNPERFSMNHSFGFTMASRGGMSYSYGIYTNQMQYLLTDHLTLQTNLSFVQPTFSSLSGKINAFNGQTFLQAKLKYQPTENSRLELSFDNYPIYRYRYYNTMHPYLNAGPWFQD